MRSNTLLVILVAFALTGVASLAGAKPAEKEHDDKFVLQNDHITVWFQGKKPMLKVFPTGEDDNGTGAYSYKFHRVVEYRDTNGDHIPDAGEILGTLNLEKASAWVVNRTTLDDGTIVLNLTMEAPVKLDIETPPTPVGEGIDRGGSIANITLIFTIREAATAIEGTNLTVPAAAIKYDFIVNAWPFMDRADTRLALDLRVGGALSLNATSGIPTASVNSNGTMIGGLAWTPNATAYDADGNTTDIPVIAATGPSNATDETRLIYTYDVNNFTRLVHDPVIGVGSEPAGSPDESNTGTPTTTTTTDVPAPGVWAVIAVAGLAALAARRRR